MSTNPLEVIALSVTEAARVSGLSRTTIYGLINEGYLPRVKIGTRTLVLRSDLEALLVARRAA